jgi:hypothetical protein
MPVEAIEPKHLKSLESTERKEECLLTGMRRIKQPEGVASKKIRARLNFQAVRDLRVFKHADDQI